jgi:hypothetical protein
MNANPVDFYWNRDIEELVVTFQVRLLSHNLLEHPSVCPPKPSNRICSVGSPESSPGIFDHHISHSVAYDATRLQSLAHAV